MGDHRMDNKAAFLTQVEVKVERARVWEVRGWMLEAVDHVFASGLTP
jgi:hypothetical protein